MRLLFAIPHYFAKDGTGSQRHGSGRPDPAPRIRALSECIFSLHQQFAASQCEIQIKDHRTQAANEPLSAEVHVVVCTSNAQHLLGQLQVDRTLYQHFPTDLAPTNLGFHCANILRDRWGNYDYYCYLEDDLILRDPWIFTKLAWFNTHVGQHRVLLPNRFERGPGPMVLKTYVDGDIKSEITKPFQDISDEPSLESNLFGMPIVFRRPTNPHSGCYFLNAEQMQQWMNKPFFDDRNRSFIGPLESAATLGIMRAFSIYKPALRNASFLEIEHFGTQFISQLRPV